MLKGITILVTLTFIILCSCCVKDPSGEPEPNGETPTSDSCRVTIFPVPDGIAQSEDYSVKVCKQDAFCYATFRLDNLNPTEYYHGAPVSPTSFVMFDFTDSAYVEITPRKDLLKDIGKLVVRPGSLNINPNWDGNKLSFLLEKPVDFTIDIQGDGMNPLHFFTNYPETEIPKPDDPGVIYFGPGIHEVSQVILNSNETLYLAGGAVLRPAPPEIPGTDLVVRGENFIRAKPMISSEFASSVRIMGRGIISGARATELQRKANIIDVQSTNNVEIRDIILMDANNWNVHIYNSTNTTVDHIRVLGYYINTDAVCFNNSRKGVARNCFVHTNDDSFEVKASTPGLTCRDILFEDCIVWNDFASCMGVTHEVRGTISNITWQNITITRFNPVVSNNWLMHRAAIFVHAAGGGKVSDLYFRNINIEMTDTKQSVILIDNIKTTVPNINDFPDKPYNIIESIEFENIYGYNLSTPNILVFDESGKGLIRNISFKNVMLNNERIVNGDPRLKITAAQNVEVLD